MTAETAETRSQTPGPPPADGPSWLPGPGTYTAEAGRCIVELTARCGPFVTLRRRLTASGAVLTVVPDAEGCVLHLGLKGGPLRRSTLSFDTERVAPADQGARILCHGELTLHGKPVSATLPLRVVERADDRLLVTGTMRMPYSLLRAATGFALPRTRPADRLRLLVAAEFT
ncbi:hypothetical protein [Streptomyces winkii]|uniref:hypothetical protein n=1 Tax=Streptomyces winkii TaxID=3051178 RepID=UPI0028D3A35D|nr:hypothetical protein [Streptomyces sp. DSM 40971]